MTDPAYKPKLMPTILPVLTTTGRLCVGASVPTYPLGLEDVMSVKVLLLSMMTVNKPGGTAANKYAPVVVFTGAASSAELPPFGTSFAYRPVTPVPVSAPSSAALWFRSE
jgi:hypothetical protein